MVILTVYQVVIKSSFIIITVFNTQISIIIYGDFPATQIRLAEIAEIYLRLWENDIFTVRVPPKKLMPIDILFDVKIKQLQYTR